MRRASIVLATAFAAVGLATSVASAASVTGDGGPPFSYGSCLKATKDKGESPSYGKWHCDQLVKKGWVSPPTR